MTPQVLAACTGSSIMLAEKYSEGVSMALDAYEINSPIRQACFLPNIGVESGGLTRTVENLNYRSSALITTFGRHRISIEDANRYGRSEDGKRIADQEAIANCVYGGVWGAQNLGNDQRGDGWKFRGHGLYQLTGKYNFRKVRDRLRLKFPQLKVPDFDADPSQLSSPMWAALSAGDFWNLKELESYADRGDFDGVCDLLNMGKKTEEFGDANGWAERFALHKRSKVALRIA